MSHKRYSSASEYSLAAKLGDLVKEIIIQNDIPHYRIEALWNGNTPLIKVISYFKESLTNITMVLAKEFNLTALPQEKVRGFIDGFTSDCTYYTASLNATRSSLVEYKKIGTARFEIHVCTVLQDALVCLESELELNSDTPSEELKRDFQRIGALMETVEMSFRSLKAQLKKTEEPKAPFGPVRGVEEAEPNDYVTVAPKEVIEAIKPQPEVLAEHVQPVAPVVKEEPVKASSIQFVQENSQPAPAPAAKPVVTVINGHGNLAEVRAESNKTPHNGIDTGIERNLFSDLKPSTIIDDNVGLDDDVLKDFVGSSRLLKEIDLEISKHANATLNRDIDIEGDTERLRFLGVFTLRQLKEKLADHKDEIISFAAKWIGKDNGGAFDSGICLFYLEYVLVGKKNDPAFSVEYVLKFISDNDYSARYIIPTYESVKSSATDSPFMSLKK